VNNFEDVGIFHERFGLHNATFFRPGPRRWDRTLLEFRLKFLKEELKEFEDAMKRHDDAEMFDALIDLVYVAMGTAHLQGYPWEEGWDAVQRANMQKVRALPDGSDSKRDSSFDVVKPNGWTAPDIAAILKNYGFDGAPDLDLEGCPSCRRTWEEVDAISGRPEAFRVEAHGMTFCSNYCVATWY
jgi:predicted HAD superfamily Cof-like phosphohydrolase